MYHTQHCEIDTGAYSEYTCSTSRQ